MHSRLNITPLEYVFLVVTKGSNPRQAGCRQCGASGLGEIEFPLAT
jgi:hypothetical protein